MTPHNSSCGGGGTGLIAFLGAAKARHELLGDPVNGAGASAGSLEQAVAIYGLDHEVVKRKTFDAVVSGRMLKLRPDLWKGALVDWRVLGQLIDELFGKGTRLGDVPKGRNFTACVTPLNGGGPRYMSSKTEPRVLLSELCSASSAFKVGVTGAVKITSHLLGTYTPDPFLYVDGGRTDNVCDSCHDEEEAPNVAFRLGSKVNPENERVVREGDLVGMSTAEELCSLWAANQPKSKRKDGLLVQVDGENLWSFKQTEDDLQDQYDRGYRSAHTQIKEWLDARSQPDQGSK